jgi:hypothetical protein
MPLVVILFLALCPTSTTSTAAFVPYSNNNTNNTNDTDTEFPLPRVQLQFICGYDVRATFNASRIFEDFYDAQDIPNAHVRTYLLKMSGMEDIQPYKWYYSSCNISSPQVLITLIMDGWAATATNTTTSTTTTTTPTTNNYNGNNNETSSSSLAELVTPMTLHTYLEDTVCTDMEYFRAVVVSEWASDSDSDDDESLSSSSSEAEDIQNSLLLAAFESGKNLDHTMFKLCGGADFDYYDEDNEHANSGFVLLGFMVGMVMVGMIFSELQKVDNRRPVGQVRRRRFAPTTSITQEFEMV